MQQLRQLQATSWMKLALKPLSPQACSWPASGVHTNAPDALCWLVLKVNVIVVASIQHFESFMMDASDDGPYCVGKLAKLATGKAAAIAAEYEDDLDNTATWESLFQACPPALLPLITEFIVGLTCLSFASFSRRIVWPSHKYRVVCKHICLARGSHGPVVN